MRGRNRDYPTNDKVIKVWQDIKDIKHLQRRINRKSYKDLSIFRVQPLLFIMIIRSICLIRNLQRERGVEPTIS